MCAGEYLTEGGEMKWLRFLKPFEYIKKLESIIAEYERKRTIDDAVIITKNKTIEEKNHRILELMDLLKEKEAEISKLKSEPPEPKLASNIDISDPIFQKMIKAGRAVLVKKAHPDGGGTREEFEKVEKAYEILKGLKIQPQEKPYTFGHTAGHPNEDILREYNNRMQGMAAAQSIYRSGLYGLGSAWPFYR